MTELSSTTTNDSRSELHRVIKDIGRAVDASSLVPEQQRKGGRFHRLKRTKRQTIQESSSASRSLVHLTQSELEERTKPIHKALERIDAQKLLDLDVIDIHSTRRLSSKSSSSSTNSEKREDGYGGNSNPTPQLRSGVYCRPICGQIRPRMRIRRSSLGRDESSSVIRYLHVDEIPNRYTIGIFVFGPNEKIPLHDHPEMCVLSRVLYGDLMRLSLDLDPNAATPRQSSFSNNNNQNENDNKNHSRKSVSSSPDAIDVSSSSHSNGDMDDGALSPQTTDAGSWLSRGATWLRNSFPKSSNLEDAAASVAALDIENNLQADQGDLPEGTKIAYTNGTDFLAAPQVAALFPHKGNLHEFVAGPHGAAVLDVLLPPYDDEEERDCTFYEIREMESGTSKGWRKPCMIVPTGQPENFHCISGRYRSIGEIDEDEEELRR